MSSFAERAATLAFTKFEALPLKSKPRKNLDGTREWVPLSAVILAQHLNEPEEEITCVSLATGTKCIPHSALPKCLGTVLHDCHAEILALRGLNWFLLSEIQSMFEFPDFKSSFVQWRSSSSHEWNQAGNSKPFEIHPHRTIHLFSTEAPCGDASMDLLINSKAELCPEEAIPWPNAETTLNPTSAPTLHGRAYFSALGVVRRKPSRGDAEPTLSKSCTDKLALKQFTSILSFPTSLFITPTKSAFLQSLILSADKYDEQGFQRAFGSSGRLASATFGSSVTGLPEVQQLHVDVLPASYPPFEFAKPNTSEGKRCKVGNISALWIRGPHEGGGSVNETLVNGVKQGSKQFSEVDLKMSIVCRHRLWNQALRVSKLMQIQGEAEDDRKKSINPMVLKDLEDALTAGTYGQAKSGVLLQSRRSIKEAVSTRLRGWVRNTGDDNWGLRSRY